MQSPARSSPHKRTQVSPLKLQALTRNTPKRTPRKQQLIDEEHKSALENWTPTRANEQLQNKPAAARKPRAWERVARSVKNGSDGERVPRRIYKRFEPLETKEVMEEHENVDPTSRVVKKLRGPRGAAIEASREDMPGYQRKTRKAGPDEEFESVDAASHAEEIETPAPGPPASAASTVDAEEASFALDVTAQDLEFGPAAHEFTHAGTASEQEQEHAATASQLSGLAAGPAASIQPDDQHKHENASAAFESNKDAQKAENVLVTEALPARVFELGQHSESAASKGAEDAMTKRTPPRSLEMAETRTEERRQSVEREQNQELAREQSSPSAKEAVGSPSAATPNARQSVHMESQDKEDLFDLGTAVGAPTAQGGHGAQDHPPDGLDPGQQQVTRDGAGADDMFAVSIESLPRTGTQAAGSPTSGSPLWRNAGDDTISLYETTTTVQLNDNDMVDDDETVLRDFLHRSKASKAAKIAKRSSLSNRRDSGIVRTALSSPRTALAELDTNSPVMSPTPVSAEAAALETLHEAGTGSPRRAHRPDGLGEVDELSAAGSAPSRRSSRSSSSSSSRGGKDGVPSIALRRRSLKIKRSDAQELHLQTRQNTKRNKGGAVSAATMLQRLREAQPESAVERAAAGADGRGVRWKRDEDLVSYLSIEAREARETSDEAAKPEPVEDEAAAAAAAAAPKGRSTRLRALGAMNGTPAKAKMKVGLEGPEREPDGQAAAAREPEPEKETPAVPVRAAQGKPRAHSRLPMPRASMRPPAAAQ